MIIEAGLKKMWLRMNSPALKLVKRVLQMIRKLRSELRVVGLVPRSFDSFFHNEGSFKRTMVTRDIVYGQ